MCVSILSNMAWTEKFYALAALTLSAAIYSFYNWGFGGCFIILLITGLISLDIARLCPDRTHKLKGLLLMYFLIRLLPLIGWFVIENFKKKAETTGKLQKSVLLDILSTNKDTEFGKKHNFANIRSREEYRQAVPLTSYPDYEGYIQRYMEGEQGMLVNFTVDSLAVTSGTTGHFKRFIYKSWSSHLMPWMAYMHRKITKNRLGKQVILNHRPKVETTKGGLTISTYSYLAYKNIKFDMPHAIGLPITLLVSDQEMAHYILAFLALADMDMGEINGAFAVYCYSFFKIIVSNWKELCSNIERGRISSTLEIDKGLRRMIDAEVKPDKARADELRRIFSSRTSNKSLAKKIWPNLVGVSMITTGAQATYAKILLEEFLFGVSCTNYLHGSTEGIAGMMYPVGGKFINAYALFILINQFEFIHEENMVEEQPPTLFPEELEVGQCYEMVYTTHAGLYRYRQGDVIRIVDFVNQCPVYQFAYRRNQALRHGRTSEYLLSLMIEGATCDLKDIMLIDFTACESIDLIELRDADKDDQVHYVIFLELEKDDQTYKLTPSEKTKFEELMCEVSEVYRLLRHNNSLGPLEVVQVKLGGFQKLREEVTRANRTTQYKTPKVIIRKELLNALLQQSAGGE